jgi:release factor glutamine methyltransferase
LIGEEHAVSEVVTALRAAGCVFAEDEAQLLMSAAGSPAELAESVARRVTGEPLEYILGWAEFCGLRIAVATGVFVPRRRTEFLAQQAISLTEGASLVVDLCCGTGAIGAAVAAGSEAVVYAADIDPVAVACARRNLPADRVFQGDLFHPLPRSLTGRVDVLVVNAPYVPTAAIALMPPEARLYEARLALDGGDDGLDVHRRVSASARRWLAPGGHLLIETSRPQSPQTAKAMTDAGLRAHVTRSEELDGTVVIGRAPGH